jgi:DNA-binding response OmpR family regulator
LDTIRTGPEGDGKDLAVLATILVVDGDVALTYLLERYAQRGGFRFCQVRFPWQSLPERPAGLSILWLPSMEMLEAVRPRETGLVGDGSPVIVCSSAGEEGRAQDLGADLCATHPLTYPDFLEALRAVGARTEEERRPSALREMSPDGSLHRRRAAAGPDRSAVPTESTQ